MTTTLQKTVMLLLVAAAIGVTACSGGVTTAHDTRESARDKATTATCDRYKACGLIGTEMTDAYMTYDSCATIWRGMWEQRFPGATCTAINQDGLAVCLNAIGATACDSIVDFVLTLSKCEEVDVCLAAPNDGGAG